jgi:hypothetical protein
MAWRRPRLPPRPAVWPALRITGCRDVHRVSVAQSLQSGDHDLLALLETGGDLGPAITPDAGLHLPALDGRAVAAGGSSRVPTGWACSMRLQNEDVLRRAPGDYGGLRHTQQSALAGNHRRSSGIPSLLPWPGWCGGRILTIDKPLLSARIAGSARRLDIPVRRGFFGLNRRGSCLILGSRKAGGGCAAGRPRYRQRRHRAATMARPVRCAAAPTPRLFYLFWLDPPTRRRPP